MPTACTSTTNPPRFTFDAANLLLVATLALVVGILYVAFIIEVMEVPDHTRGMSRRRGVIVTIASYLCLLIGGILMITVDIPLDSLLRAWEAQQIAALGFACQDVISNARSQAGAITAALTFIFWGAGMLLLGFSFIARGRNPFKPYNINDLIGLPK